MTQCKHHIDGQCKHTAQPYGPRPSNGVCLKACELYEGPPRGLGDTIAKLTKVTGIKAATKAVADVTGRDCKCAERQRKLNELVPYTNKESQNEKA